jgi:hypothetical protein
VRDAQTGELHDDIYLHIHPGRRLYTERKDAIDSGQPVLTYPERAFLNWTVQKPGYACASGDERAFTEARGDGLRLAEVRLERGWKLSVAAWDDDSGDPLQGVQVLCDGVLVGTTDAEGLLERHMPGPPAELRVALAGWQLTFPDEFGAPVDWRSCGDVWFGMERVR